MTRGQFTTETADPTWRSLYKVGGTAASATDAQRTMLLAAGQTLLTSLQSSTFYVSYILMAAAGLITSTVMLRSNNNIFSKLTAYVGILASVLGLGLFVPTIGLLLSLISLIPTVMWYILIARRLFQLG
ncbi:MAG: hypothetical protein M3299_00290 [Thermoproteota archaeon]|nr:hypothetical protein [Thermoproteota archaeon]